MTGKIFISYRRSDTEAMANRMFEWLAGEFGRDAVFIDNDGIPAGVDFREHIAEQVRQARVVLVVIGGGWLETIVQRSSDDGDWLRFEIETAFNAGKDVVPVLVDRAAMPDAKVLPATIARLAFLNAATVSTPAKDFRHHMELIADRLTVGLRFERRMAAPAVVGNARPATADLVTPARVRGPALPAPKVGERWEKLAWPKQVDKSWRRFLVDRRRRLFGTWAGSTFPNISLAVCDGSRIGFVEFSQKQYEMHHPFSMSESPGEIHHLASGDDRVVLLASNSLSTYYQGGSGENIWKSEVKMHPESALRGSLIST